MSFYFLISLPAIFLRRRKIILKCSQSEEPVDLHPLNHDSNMGNSFFQNSEISFKMSVACFILLLLTPRQMFLGKNITIKQNTTQNSH